MLIQIIIVIIAYSSLMFLIYWLGKPIKSSFDKNWLVWVSFKKVLRECEIKTGEDFEHFMSVVGYYTAGADYEEDILKVWKEHKDSIKKSVKRIKTPEQKD